MRSLFFLITLVSLNASAGFEKLNVQNLDLDYKAPHGSGTVEKVGIGMSLNPEAFPVEINRTENSFDLTSPYVDFTWYRPLKFMYDVQELVTKKTSVSLGTDVHYVESDYVTLKPGSGGDYKAEKLKAICDGDAKGEFEERLLEDCRTKLELTIKKIDVPADFFLLRILESIPQIPAPEADMPADNVVANIKNGDFHLQFYIKYVFYAGLRAWGHMQYENNHQVIALRVDTIKFGYLPVTGIVMKKLKEIIKSPDVKIDPPWIRINIEKIHDTQSR
jgi:hypothetical protein